MFRFKIYMIKNIIKIIIFIIINMELQTFKNNIKDSINQYRNLSMSFSPNYDDKDNIILDAIDNATDLTQVGILGFLRSDRFTKPNFAS